MPDTVSIDVVMLDDERGEPGAFARLFFRVAGCFEGAVFLEGFRAAAMRKFLRRKKEKERDHHSRPCTLTQPSVQGKIWATEPLQSLETGAFA